MVFQGSASLGSFVILLFYVVEVSGKCFLTFITCRYPSLIRLLVLDPLNVVGILRQRLREDIANAGLLAEFLHLTPTVQNEPGAKRLHITTGDIYFEGVSFYYDPLTLALEDASFHARPWQTVALVGSKGAGKSTIFKLILRLHDVTKGSVQIDNQDVRDVTIESLREHLGIVSGVSLLCCLSH